MLGIISQQVIVPIQPFFKHILKIYKKDIAKILLVLPGPVAFPLSLPGLDRTSLVLPQGQRPGFFGPTKTLGQGGPTGAEEWLVRPY